MGELTITYNMPSSELKTGVITLPMRYFGGVADRGDERWVLLGWSLMDGEQITIMAKGHDGRWPVDLSMLDKVMLWEITKEEYDKREEGWR